MLNVLGRDYLNAIVTPAVAQYSWVPRTFMTFDPVDTFYHPPGTPGSYISTVPSIETYALTFQHLLDKHLDEDILFMFTLVIIYDFMAFTAQTMRKARIAREPSAILKVSGN